MDEIAERAKFEEWVSNRPDVSHIHIPKDFIRWSAEWARVGAYKSGITEVAWQGWKAALAAQEQKDISRKVGT